MVSDLFSLTSNLITLTVRLSSQDLPGASVCGANRALLECPEELSLEEVVLRAV